MVKFDDTVIPGHLYVGLIQANRIEGDELLTGSKATWTIAQSEAEALARFFEKAKMYYPECLGWTEHYFEAALVSSEMVLALKGHRNGQV